MNVHIEKLKGINFFCENDLYNLAILSHKIANASNTHPNSHVTITIHGLASRYASIATNASTKEVEQFLISKSFDPRSQILVNDNY